MLNLILGHDEGVYTCNSWPIFFNFDTHEWMLLEQVDDCEELSKFLSSEKWTNFSLGKGYLDFVFKYPKRVIILDK